MAEQTVVMMWSALQHNTVQRISLSLISLSVLFVMPELLHLVFSRPEVEEELLHP